MADAPRAAAAARGVHSPLTAVLATLRAHASPQAEHHRSCAGTMPRLVSPLRAVIATLWSGPAAHASSAEWAATAADTLELLTLLADTTHCANGLRAFGDAPAATVRAAARGW